MKIIYTIFSLFLIGILFYTVGYMIKPKGYEIKMTDYETGEPVTGLREHITVDCQTKDSCIATYEDGSTEIVIPDDDGQIQIVGKKKMIMQIMR